MPTTVLGWDTKSDKTRSCPQTPQSVEEIGNGENSRTKCHEESPVAGHCFGGTHILGPWHRTLCRLLREPSQNKSLHPQADDGQTLVNRIWVAASKREGQ